MAQSRVRFIFYDLLVIYLRLAAMRPSPLFSMVSGVKEPEDHGKGVLVLWTVTVELFAPTGMVQFVACSIHRMIVR